MPHKQVALGLTEADARARAVGAANTLWYVDGSLRSTNTDVEGFLANLDSSTPGWDRGLESAVVLGAGGAARAVVFALIQRDVQRIHVINRTIAHAEALQRQFGARVRRPAGGARDGSAAPASWSIRPRWAWKESAALTSILALPRLAGGGRSRLSPAAHEIVDDGPRSRIADGRRSRHAPAPSGSRLHAVVRQKARNNQ